MSHRMTLRGHVSLGEGRQRYNSANQLLTMSFCQFCKSGCDWGLYRQCTLQDASADADALAYFPGAGSSAD
jgi:hypothetical protein